MKRGPKPKPTTERASVMFSLRVTPAVAADVREIAADLGVSNNGLVAMCVQRGLATFSAEVREQLRLAAGIRREALNSARRVRE